MRLSACSTSPTCARPRRGHRRCRRLPLARRFRRSFGDGRNGNHRRGTGSRSSICLCGSSVAGAGSPRQASPSLGRSPRLRSPRLRPQRSRRARGARSGGLDAALRRLHDRGLRLASALSGALRSADVRSLARWPTSTARLIAQARHIARRRLPLHRSLAHHRGRGRHGGHGGGGASCRHSPSCRHSAAAAFRHRSRPRRRPIIVSVIWRQLSGSGLGLDFGLGVLVFFLEGRVHPHRRCNAPCAAECCGRRRARSPPANPSARRWA